MSCQAGRIDTDASLRPIPPESGALLRMTNNCRGFSTGLIVDSSWCTGAPLQFRALRQGASQSTLEAGCSVLSPIGGCPISCGQDRKIRPPISTWQFDPCPGGTTVQLQVDRAEYSDTEEEAENTWLPVLASLQALLSRDESP